MRLNIRTTKATSTVPYDHQPVLTGALHKWAGQNEEHDQVSLYSFSRLRGAYAVPSGRGLRFPDGADWFISCFSENFAKRILNGILTDPRISYGMEVTDVMIQETPTFTTSQVFMVASPVFAKHKRQDGSIEHCLFDNPIADQILTKVLQNKLGKAGLSDETAKVEFVRDYSKARTHKSSYQGIDNRVSTCPVLITGKSETLAFAWEVGVGHSTGIGFGALY
jgi:CRISPR-associated endoribonuclease Cas6